MATVLPALSVLCFSVPNDAITERVRAVSCLGLNTWADGAPSHWRKKRRDGKRRDDDEVSGDGPAC